MGPMQGDQPAAKARPKRKDPESPLVLVPENLAIRRESVLKNFRKSKSMFIPSIITTMPPIMPMYWDALLPPTNMAEPEKITPSIVKARVKPAEKARLRPKSLALSSPLDRAATLEPEIKDRYAGIRGRTQGERKDKSPARAAENKPGVFIGGPARPL